MHYLLSLLKVTTTKNFILGYRKFIILNMLILGIFAEGWRLVFGNILKESVKTLLGIYYTVLASSPIIKVKYQSQATCEVQKSLFWVLVSGGLNLRFGIHIGLSL